MPKYTFFIHFGNENNIDIQKLAYRSTNASRRTNADSCSSTLKNPKNIFLKRKQEFLKIFGGLYDGVVCLRGPKAKGARKKFCAIRLHVM